MADTVTNLMLKYSGVKIFKYELNYSHDFKTFTIFLKLFFYSGVTMTIL